MFFKILSYQILHNKKYFLAEGDHDICNLAKYWHIYDFIKVTADNHTLVRMISDAINLSRTHSVER